MWCSCPNARVFSIDMYVADAASGAVIRRLVETATDPHFDSLEFLGSAGDWAPDNRRFVFAALRKGQPGLVIIDTVTGSREREHVFPELGQIFNPVWSPDGRRVAFSALSGGFLDLYLFDLESATLARLTEDAYADLDPEWSPDGRSLAWVTDRFSSDVERLSFGNYRIGLMDATTRTAREFAGFPRGRNTNPEFAAGGRQLYFIGAPDGIPNIYREDQGVSRISNVMSGVSGITPLTPALSVAAAAPGVMFTVFEEDRVQHLCLDAGPWGGLCGRRRWRAERGRTPGWESADERCRESRSPTRPRACRSRRPRRLETMWRASGWRRSGLRWWVSASTGEGHSPQAASRSSSRTCWATTPSGRRCRSRTGSMKPAVRCSTSIAPPDGTGASWPTRHPTSRVRSPAV